MKKKLFLSLALLLAAALQVMAKPVTQDIAFLQAKFFLQEKGVFVDDDMLSIIEGPKVNEETVAYYVVNNGNDGGFVIISGDDRGKAILGYSESGHYSLNSPNEQMQYILKRYAQEMIYLDEHHYVGKEDMGPARTQTPTHTAVQPMTTTKWGQREPFYNSTPLNGDSHTMAGCLPVAVSQIIYYYRDRMPSKLQVDIPGYSSGGYTLKTVKKGTAFNWNNMFDEYNATQTSAQKTNVANFVLYVGTALKSTYGLSVTKATVDYVGKRLKEYFGFSEGTFITRTDYTYGQWKRILINELEQGRPVLYSAALDASNAHSFVIDGYDGDDLFHINWGWYGMDNGYYSLSVLNHLDREGNDAGVIEGMSYIYRSKAFIGLQPLNGYNSVDNNTKLNALNNSLTNSSGTYTLKVTYTNKTANSKTYTCGIGYVDGDKNIQVFKEWSKGETTIGSEQTTGVVSYTISGSDFAAKKLTAKKTYKLYPISKVKGGDWELCDQHVSSTTYVNCDYQSSSSMTATLKKAEPFVSVSNFEFPGAKTKGAKQYVKVTLVNNGDDFYGNVYLFVSTTASKGSYSSYFPTFVPAGETVTLYLTFTPKYAKTYNIWVCSASSGSSELGKTTVTIKDGSYSRKLVSGGLTVNNCTDKKVLGTTFAGTLKVKNSAAATYAGIVKVQLCWLHPTKKKWISLDASSVKFMEIPSGETDNINFKFEGLNPNVQYGLFYFYGEDNTLWSSSSYVTGYKMSYAVMCYNQEGEISSVFAPAATVSIPSDAVAVDLSGTTGTVTKVVPNSKTNTLYYVGDNDTKPSGLSGKNFIKGAKADNITLVDKEPFFVLKYFTASNISFTLKPTIGAPKSGVGGWQTFVLPFSPTSVMCENHPLDWFKSKDDERKQFWVKDFCAIQGASNVCFGFAQTINANQPYLYTVPNQEWGANNNLVGKNIVFSASNAFVYADPIAVSASSAYNFRGTYTNTTLSNIYTLNAAGTKFVKGKATVKPFGCYFVATQDDNTDVNALNITSFDPDEETGITLLPVEEEKTVDVYSVGGMKVGKAVVRNGQVDLQDLPKGIYVVNGKKIIK